MKTAKRQKVRRGIIFFTFLMFPVLLNYFSPYLILYGAYQGIVAASFFTFIALFVASLFLGRAFCGWVCPISGMQEAAAGCRTKKAKTGGGNVVRWVIWIAWLSFIIYLLIKAGGIKEVDYFLHTENGISILNPIVVYVYIGVVLLIYAYTMIWGQRAFCKYLCWISPFMIIGDKIRHWLKIPGLYLKPKKENCIECGRCSKECPMDINVEKMVQNEDMYSSECIMCLNCVDICPKKAITTK